MSSSSTKADQMEIRENEHQIANPQFQFDDEQYPTFTSNEQKNVEELIEDAIKESGEQATILERDRHIFYAVRQLSEAVGFSKMDASRSWFCFWGIHTLRMLDYKIPDDLSKRIIKFLRKCENNETGGYGGAPGQISHLATTYASVMALVSIGTKEALDSINRATLLKFLFANKNSNGSFTVHEGGESDIRGVYCAAAVAVTCGIASDKLFENSVSWIMRCQTYEGGFAGEPNCEAHGGYTLCGVAALSLLGQRNQIDDEALLRWLVMRQMPYEGGFQGRTGKLVDACYSYWQTASCFVAEAEIQREWGIPIKNSLFNNEGLQKFLLGASQRFKSGGFCDKPGRHPDLYHTCYALAGLSLAQMRNDSPILCVGGKNNVLNPVNHLLNVTQDEAKYAFQYFTQNPLMPSTP